MEGIVIRDKVERRSVDSLIPYARNARTHSDEQVDQLAASIRKFGWNGAILVDGSGSIIAGHGRVMAAKKIGMREVPVIDASDMTEAERRAYIIADNKLALNAGWDVKLLSFELSDLQGSGFEMSFTGFNPDELQALFGPATVTEVEGAKEIGSEEFDSFDCKCPKCGFEFNK